LCSAIELLVLDVDGVLTDGSIIYSDKGDELKKFYVRDGSAIKFWRDQGKEIAFLTGRNSRALDLRAADLGVRFVVQGAQEKFVGFQRILADTGMQSTQACCMGDDLPDLPVLANCGLAVAVADACPEVTARAHYVTHLPGGRGAVSETIRLILSAQNLWDSVLRRYQDTRLKDS
jgi:3-deoxy-D-manno-octulosonate 8-phosphate phosphatase (KDO 8-P phosphatase)